ncbi:hypothetical protein [Actinophytocola sp.]|uniref:PPE domain-containing protein n=1 Tax=Actinophytocola sp. TaxID=1872138 RepID=UPI00389A7AFF
MTDRGGWVSPFLTPAEIYRQLTEGKGPGALQEEQTQTVEERAEEEDRAAQVRSLANEIQAGWQGDASSGAYGAAMPLAERMLENAAKLDRSQDLLARQVDSFNTAVRSVRPVSDPPEMSVDEPFPFDVDHDKAVAEYQDAAQNNIEVFRVYDGASHYNETNLPQEYHAGNRAGGDVSVEESGDVIEVGDPGPRGGDPKDTGPFSGGPYPGQEPAPGGYPPGVEHGPSEYRPTSTAGRPPTPGVTYPSTYPGGSYPNAGQSAPVAGGPGFVGGVPVGGYGDERGFGPRGGSGGGEPGGVRGTGGEPGGVRGPGAVRGPGGRGPGAGTGALAAEEAAARRAAARAAGGGRPGGAVGAPVGGGRNKDDEDAEHQRKVLIEADAEEMFGSDELTAPQVIGDDEYED